MIRADRRATAGDLGVYMGNAEKHHSKLMYIYHSHDQQWSNTKMVKPKIPAIHLKELCLWMDVFSCQSILINWFLLIDRIVTHVCPVNDWK